MRYWLKVPYHKRQQAKDAGCWWSPERRMWYIDDPAKLSDFKAWHPVASVSVAKRLHEALEINAYYREQENKAQAR